MTDVLTWPTTLRAMRGLLCWTAATAAPWTQLPAVIMTRPDHRGGDHPQRQPKIRAAVKRGRRAVHLAVGAALEGGRAMSAVKSPPRESMPMWTRPWAAGISPLYKSTYPG